MQVLMKEGLFLFYRVSLVLWSSARRKALVLPCDEIILCLGTHRICAPTAQHSPIDQQSSSNHSLETLLREVAMNSCQERKENVDRELSQKFMEVVFVIPVLTQLHHLVPVFYPPKVSQSREFMQ